MVFLRQEAHVFISYTIEEPMRCQTTIAVKRRGKILLSNFSKT